MRSRRKEEEEGEGVALDLNSETNNEEPKINGKERSKRKKKENEDDEESSSSNEEQKKKEPRRRSNKRKDRRASFIAEGDSEAVCELIRLFSDENAMKRALRSNGLDLEKFTLKNLTKQRLDDGLKELKKIEKVFNEPNEDPLDLLLFSHTFYKLFPPARPYLPLTSPFPPVIQTQQQLSSKMKLLENLSMLYNGIEAIEEARNEPSSVPFERRLMNNLGVSIRLMDKFHPKWDSITQYIKNTIEGSPFQVQNVFSVEHLGEDVELQKENRLLLCRGVSSYKHLGILRSENDQKHSATANALLFSDIFYSSIEEAYNGEESSTVCIHLEEVALGNAFEGDFILKELPNGFDSVICRGSFGPDFTQNVKTEEGYSIPVGKPRPFYTRSSLAASFSRYFVYNQDQIKLRFLALIKFSDPNIQQQQQQPPMQYPLSNIHPTSGWNVPPYNPMVAIQRSTSPIMLPPPSISNFPPSVKQVPIMGPPTSPAVGSPSKSFS
eukprot:TRINITY_DN2577_c0_g4_i1.p1 TRINITY_DN2577_c0_g4~~TRINITY_DN2577_c0_g4_i1.p1  ORF type:complete len:545 (+),score=144.46 TRINITY_DN2577_c0_g4_i1:153-1637(+)